MIVEDVVLNAVLDLWRVSNFLVCPPRLAWMIGASGTRGLAYLVPREREREREPKIL